MGSWLVGSVATKNPRDRQLVALAGVIPDLDGFGMIVDVARITWPFAFRSLADLLQRAGLPSSDMVLEKSVEVGWLAEPDHLPDHFHRLDQTRDFSRQFSC